MPEGQDNIKKMTGFNNRSSLPERPGERTVRAFIVSYLRQRAGYAKACLHFSHSLDNTIYQPVYQSLLNTETAQQSIIGLHFGQLDYYNPK